MPATTVQRISKVLRHYAKGNDIKTVTASNASDVLDLLDDFAGIDTKYIDGHSCNRGWDCAGDHEEPRQLGARVALHEKVIDNDKYFLGIGDGDGDEEDEEPYEPPEISYHHWLGDYQ